MSSEKSRVLNKAHACRIVEFSQPRNYDPPVHFPNAALLVIGVFLGLLAAAGW